MRDEAVSGYLLLSLPQEAVKEPRKSRIPKRQGSGIRFLYKQPTSTSLNMKNNNNNNIN